MKTAIGCAIGRLMQIDSRVHLGIVAAALGLISLRANSSTASPSVYFDQYNRSIVGVTSNILPNGAVIASPSQVAPNYYFDWVRDTALTMKTLIRIAYLPTSSQALRSDLNTKIDTWINWELNRQLVPKLTDLGEPRFNVDGSANHDPWGRPQNDAPASRALAGIELANRWINEGRMSEVEARLYYAELPAHTLIKRDLEYVAAHWSDSSYDLWEEERATHFYTLTVQKAALLKGAELARKMNDGAAAIFYASQAKGIQNLLDQFYDPKQGIIRYSIDKVLSQPQKTTDLDIAVVLAAIQTFDGTFYVNANQVLSTLNALMNQARKVFSVNGVATDSLGSALGIAIGRYPNDLYSGFDFSGGNPWFISTLAAAEFYCDLNRAAHAPALNSRAKAQIDRALFHVGADGALSEQFNRVTGFEQGAQNLTWSHVAYLTAYQACFY